MNRDTLKYHSSVPTYVNGCIGERTVMFLNSGMGEFRGFPD